MNFKPKGNYLLLSTMDDGEKTPSGLYIPETARRTMNQGKIIAKGPFTNPTETKIGEIVVFAMHVEHRIQIGNAWYILVQESDVMCGDGGETDKKYTPLKETDWDKIGEAARNFKK